MEVLMKEIFDRVKKASRKLSYATTDTKNRALKLIAELLIEKQNIIFEKNQIDINDAKKSNLSPALIDRLVLNEKRFKSMIDGIYTIINSEDPVGIIEKGYKRPNGLTIHKVRVPIGVVGIIYESRPNVTVDAAALCLKSGNASILRGGKEAVNTNKILGEIISEAIERAGLDKDSVVIIEDKDRTKIMKMLKAKDDIDIIVPRGGEALISFCSEHSLVPLVKHDKGLCHTYIDKSADFDLAVSIAYDAKVDRPGVCNAMETLLVDEQIADKILPELCEKYIEAGVELRGCDKSVGIFDMKPANEIDWDTEYLDMVLSIKIVKDVYEAVEHINTYGSMHSESIIAENCNAVNFFMQSVDAAAVYHNASTRFTDGGEFGLGAEIGISTQKLHCRGPMGAYDLTTSKYQIYGNGQIKGKKIKG
jgi:glutamate-5-semialdehyde dehydrogenase